MHVHVIYMYGCTDDTVEPFNVRKLHISMVSMLPTKSRVSSHLGVPLKKLPLESFIASIACGGGPLQITLTSTTSEPLLEDLVSSRVCWIKQVEIHYYSIPKTIYSVSTYLNDLTSDGGLTISDSIEVSATNTTHVTVTWNLFTTNQQ